MQIICSWDMNLRDEFGATTQRQTTDWEKIAACHIWRQIAKNSKELI